MNKIFTKALFITSFVSFSSATCYSQNIGINGSGANAHASALLDVDDAGSNNKGILIPRIPLTAINASSPVTSPATSLLVYNTAIASTGTNAVSPGYYYWDGTKWVRFQIASSGSSSPDWSLTGNAGTVDGTNFIGTTDNIPFNFRVNNQKAGRIDHLIYNSFFGYQSGNVITTGDNNAGFGSGSLQSNTIGARNAALGSNSLPNNTSGTDNSSVGHRSMLLNTIGGYNSVNGSNALFWNTSGSYNSVSGAYSMYSATTASNNVTSGYKALYDITTGVNNTAIGAYSGLGITTGINNTFLGAYSNPTAGTFTNATAIGYNAKVGQSNALILGGSGSDAVKVGIGISTPLATLHVEQGSAFFRNTATNLSGVEIRGGLDGGNSSSIYLKNSLGAITTQLSDGTYDSYFQVGTAKNVGIGTSSPTEKLEVQGSVKIVDGTQGLNKVLTSDAAGKAHWQESAVNTNKLGFSITYPASIPAPATGALSTIGAPFTIATTGIYRVLVDATMPQGMILGIDNQSLSNAVVYAQVTQRYYAQYFVYIVAGTHSLIYYNDANGTLINGGPYWGFQIEGPIN